MSDPISFDLAALPIRADQQKLDPRFLSSALFVRVAILICNAILIAGCQRSRQGEAFLVLKSDDVVYMADMQVLSLRSDFARQFATWRSQSVAEADKLEDIKTRDPKLSVAAKPLEEQIAQELLEKDNLKRDAIGVVREKVQSLNTKLDALVAQQKATADAYNTYIAITDPFDQLIGPEKAKAHELLTQEQKLVDTTVGKINQVIMDDKIAAPLLGQMALVDFFALQKYTEPFFSSDALHNRGLLLNHENDTSISVHYLTFATNIPEALGGTRADQLYRDALGTINPLAVDLDATTKLMAEQVTARESALIPWSNQTGISKYDIDGFIKKHDDNQQAIQEIMQRIAALKSGGAEATALIAEEIQRKSAEIDESVEKLKNQETDLIAKEYSDALDAFEQELQTKFTNFLKQETVVSTRTGSRGDFSIPSEIAYLYAEQHRDNGETFVWLARVDPESPKIKLSNSNTAIAGNDVDPSWMLNYELK